MNLLQRFKDHIRAQQLFHEKDKLLLAVSGGVDSVVLCELCKQAGYDFMIAHCNFQLRGEESERDEEFVIQLGERYKAEVKVKKFDTENYAVENKLSTQEAARDLRYSWFKELLAPDSEFPTPGFLLTAHHADDNAETLLMNFFRGTGLQGLAAIPAKAGYIRRPLLFFSKEELIVFAKQNNLSWVEDSSNDSSKYTRNYFRNELIPALEKVFPQVRENLQDNIIRFKEIEALYRLSVGAIKKKLVKSKGNEKHISVKQLLGYNNRALIYAIIAEYGFTEKQIDELLKLAGSDSGRYIDSPSQEFRIIKHRHWFIISPVSSVDAGNIIINENDSTVLFALGTLRLQRTHDSRLTTHDSSVSVDLKEISFPLLLRKWKTGDYFYPLGMKKKKKIARFLIDLKLSKSAKEKVWVIETNQRIIWVLGHRIDERFKLTEKTKQVLKLQLD